MCVSFGSNHVVFVGGGFLNVAATNTRLFGLSSESQPFGPRNMKITEESTQVVCSSAERGAQIMQIA